MSIQQVKMLKQSSVNIWLYGNFFFSVTKHGHPTQWQVRFDNQHHVDHNYALLPESTKLVEKQRRYRQKKKQNETLDEQMENRQKIQKSKKDSDNPWFSVRQMRN